MQEPEANPWEEALIADMRAHDGAVTNGPLAGHPLLLMTATGAKTGQARRSILTYSRDGDDYIVAGTAGGAPMDPVWVNNVRVNPSVSIEVANRTFPAEATIEEGPDRERLWDAHAEALPWFAAYPETSGRAIPMIRLRPRTV